jgi:hypothetical protein
MEARAWSHGTPNDRRQARQPGRKFNLILTRAVLFDQKTVECARFHGWSS